MKHILLSRLELLFSLTTDIAHAIEEPLYKYKLAQVRSNSFGEQMGCIIGARESYLKQMVDGSEFIFDCSVDDVYNKFQIMQSLHGSAQAVIKHAKENPTNDATAETLLKILEHESQHHGQIIRYVYANGWNFPESWKKHYTV